MKPVFLKKGLLWNSQCTFVISSRFIAQKHYNGCSVEDFIKVSQKDFELEVLNYLQFYQKVVFWKNV